MKTYFPNSSNRTKLADELARVLKNGTYSLEERIEVLSFLMLKNLGYKMTEENIIDTPYRIAKMYVTELLTSEGNKDLQKLLDSCTTFTNLNTDQYIPIKGIEYSSLCSHHFLPFMGKVDVAYHPDKKILGLSKFPRIVKYFSRRAQLQEIFTTDIADFIQKVLEPKGLIVRVSGTHTCVSARGVECNMTVFTEAVHGKIDKQEVFSMWR